jgi:AcrR family transcriptional regulator
MQVATQSGLSAKPRVPLTRERVLRAALALADQAGIEALTMRRLGHDLHVEAMSLYNHVADKDEILDGMVDLVFSEIDVPADTANWKTAMRLRAISARDALLRHPWATSLMQSRAIPGDATLRHHDSVIRSLRKAGFTIDMAAHAFSVMDGYIYGFALQQMNLPSRSSEESAALAERILRELPADRYPDLAEMIIVHALKPGYTYAEEFEFGLDLILDGLEKLRSGGSGGAPDVLAW